MRSVRLAIAGLVAVLMHGSCSSPETGSTDGNTSWLERCDGDRACDTGLDCLCGVCTQACTGAGDCGGLGGARCLPSTAIDPGCGSTSTDLCSKACETRADCPSSLSCVDGVCAAAVVQLVDGGADAGCKVGGEGCERFDECCSGSCSSGQCTPEPPMMPEASDGCSSKTPPPPPASEPSTGSLAPVVFAMESIDWGDLPNSTNPPRRFLEFGFDLDGRCTTPDDPSPSECRRPEWARPIIDGVQGVDNSFGAFFQGLRNLISDATSENYSMQIEQGGHSLLVQLADWNGQPDDMQVSVAVFGAAPFDSFGSVAMPQWNGEDQWPVSSDSVVGQNVSLPRFQDRFAYVSDYRLVANLDQLGFRFVIGLSTLGSVSLEVALVSVVVSCGLEPVTVGHGWRLSSCTVGGRWSSDHLLEQLSQFPDPSSAGGDTPAPLCVDSPLYPEFKDNICRGTDIFYGSATIASACDAMSVGFEFDAYPALLGNVFTLDPVAPRCPTNVEPSRDSCNPELSEYDQRDF